MSEKTDKANLVAVTVTVTGHTHAGQPVAKGDVIHVRKPVADWMVKHKKGVHSGGAATTGKESAK